MLVQAALRAYSEITSGMKRSDVERTFSEQGAGQFRDHTRYMYRKCEYIGMEVEYTVLSDGAHPSDASNDAVNSKSRLFIDYPTHD